MVVVAVGAGDRGVLLRWSWLRLGLAAVVSAPSFCARRVPSPPTLASACLRLHSALCVL